MSGQLIVIDGTDGSGKATQTKKLIDRLKQENRPVETLDFPQYDNNVFGAKIRWLQEGKFGNPGQINPYLASVLYAADRFESSDKLRGWLAEGKTVILDRYVSANQIHQGGKIADSAERDDFLKWLDQIEFDVFGIPRPDLVIYLDVNPRTTQKLLAGRGNQDATEKNLEHQIESYEQSLRLVSQMNNWVRIVCEEDGQLLPIDVIHERIWGIVSKMI